MPNDDDDIEFISKTQRKAEADAQQMLGKKIVDLTNDQIAKLNLDESLHDAILEAKRLKSNSALRRQMQYIGKLMRNAEIAPIEEQLARWEGKHSEENARFHALERWRDRLIDEQASAKSEVLQAFVEQYPNADIQRLRTLIRNAHKETVAKKPPKSSRELFKLLREIADDHANSDDLTN